MVTCKCTKTCPFFKGELENMPSISEMLKNRYCKGDFSKCARYIIMKEIGRERVPTDCFPNQLNRAFVIVEAYRKANKS